MWQDMLGRLPADTTGAALFWSDVDRDTEQSMLRRLFNAAIEQNVLTGDQVDHFLRDVLAIHFPEAHNGADPHSLFKLEAFTRRLLDIDEKLSPLSQELFERSVLSDPDREALWLDLMPSEQPVLRAACGAY